MTAIDIMSLLITVAAFSAYLNYRALKLPATIGLMIIALALSALVVLIGQINPGVVTWAEGLLQKVDFNETLMHGMLGFLLFAGALHVDLNDLKEQRLIISILATIGVITSTVLFGTGIYFVLNHLIDMEVSFLLCCLLGSVVAPTDPIAVLGIVKKLGAPKSLETIIAGESLFNDGVAVVVFLVLMAAAGFGHGHGAAPTVEDHAATPHVAAMHDGDALEPSTQVIDNAGTLDAVEFPAEGDHGHAAAGASDAAAEHADHAGVDIGDVVLLFVKEAIGGAVFGLIIGLIAFAMLRSINQYQVEVLISLALVMGGYSLAFALGISAPIAMVVAGLLIGNHGRAFAMNETTRDHLDKFWELIDEILNAVLFVLIGLEVLILTFDGEYLLAGLIAIPLGLLARFIAVGIPITLLGNKRLPTPHVTKVLTWAGLRGGISVALALWMGEPLRHSAPDVRDAFLVITYSIVVFSIIAQGLSVGPLLRRWGLSGPAIATADDHAH